MQVDERTAHDHHAHHEMPASGRALTGMAISATLHCLTGCAIGEVAGMVIGTAAGLSNGSTVVLSIVLAFFFGYGLTSLPLLRSGLALAAVAPIAFASDTLSIATMEAVDNAIVVVIPGALAAGLGSFLFWGSLAFCSSSPASSPCPSTAGSSRAARVTRWCTRRASTAGRRSGWWRPWRRSRSSSARRCWWSRRSPPDRSGTAWWGRLR
jgi:hypothetical protein